MNTWKGMAASLVAAGMVTVAVSLVDAAVCGDVNGGGTFNGADCVQLLNVATGGPSAGTCGGAGIANCGDLNADGAINVADVVVCVNVTAGNVPLYDACTGPPAVGRCQQNGGSGTVTIPSGAIASNQLWEGPCEYLLDGTVFVNSGVTIKINPGVTVKGKKASTDTTPSALVFRRGAKIDANGTASQPIIFTSDQVTNRTKGDWGGIVLNGRAPTNVPGGEGLAEGLTNVPFGGNVPNDNSGIARYLRIEYAGRGLTVDNELNIFTLNSVGTATQIDHIFAHYGLDDGIEWFGGTVNQKFMVASAAGDDGFDWQLGFTGKLQHGLVAQNECAVETGSHGIEADNNENGFDNAPRSNPQMCNVTMLGTRGQNNSLNSIACTDPASEFGMHLRRGTIGRLSNFIVANFGGRGMRLEHTQTANQACSAGPTLTGNLLVENSIFYNNGSTGGNHADGAVVGGNCDSDSFYGLLVAGEGVVPADGVVGTDPGLTVAGAWPPVDPRPSLGSLADTHPTVDCSTIDAFFDATSYVGGFEPGGANWLTTPWANFGIDNLS